MIITALDNYNKEVRINLEEDGDYYIATFPYNKFILKLIKGCEGAKYEPESKSWRFKRPSISERTDWIFSYLFRQEPYTHFKTPATLLQPRRQGLYPYQIEDYSEIVQKRYKYLALDMGLGKTLIAIESLEHIRANYNVKDDEIWIIAPLNAIRAWREELRKWNSKLSPIFVHCDQAALEKYIRYHDIPPKVVVIDEASRFKHSNAKRTNYLLQLTKQVRQTHKDHWIIALSGTPAPKDPSNWWSQIEAQRPGYIIERDANQLKARLARIEYQEGEGGSFPTSIEWQPQEIDQFYQRLKGLVTVRFKKDHLKDLPEKIYRPIKFPMSKETEKDCKFIIETSATTLEALQKLRQYSDGFSYKNDEEFLTPKDEQLKDDLEDQDSRIVIFAAYTKSIDKIVKICQQQGWNVIRVDGRGWQGFSDDDNFQPTLQTFNTYKEKVAYVGHPMAGGMSVTLTASNTIIFYSNDFNGESRTQAEDRIHRIGSRGANIIDYLWLPTDEYVLERLKEKRKLELISLGELKNAINK